MRGASVEYGQQSFFGVADLSLQGFEAGQSAQRHDRHAVLEQVVDQFDAGFLPARRVLARPQGDLSIKKILTVAIFGDVEFYTQPAKPKSKGSPANCHDNGAGSAAPPGFSILRSLSPPPDATD